MSFLPSLPRERDLLGPSRSHSCKTIYVLSGTSSFSLMSYSQRITENTRNMAMELSLTTDESNPDLHQAMILCCMCGTKVDHDFPWLTGINDFHCVFQIAPNR